MSKTYNKVVYDGDTLIDLTSDTVDASTLAVGVTAHNAAGEAITGTMPTATNWGDIGGALSNQTDLQSALNGKYDASNPSGYTSNTGTVTSVAVKMNGSTKGTVTSSGTIDLGTVITSHQDISGKQDTITSVTHTASTAVGSATKPVYVNSSGVATATTYSLNADVPSNVASLTSTNFVASEKVYNQGSTASITLTNGRIFFCTGSSITLPTAVDGVCITCIVTASSVTWGGSIRWKGNKAPTLTADYDLVSFVGYSGYWYGA